MTFTNNGTVTANVAGTTLATQPGGTTVIGDTLSSVNSTGYDINAGVIHNSAVATLQDVTLAVGSVFNAENPLTVVGTFTNNGHVFVGGFNFNTNVYSNLNVAADATLAGSGIARMAGGHVEATNNATLTVAARPTAA